MVFPGLALAACVPSQNDGTHGIYGHAAKRKAAHEAGHGVEFAVIYSDSNGEWLSPVT
jgi:hypothetical protein